MGRGDLLKSLRKIIHNKEVNETVLRRIRDFEEIGRNREKVFSELCFCILTANYSAEGGLRIQEKCGEEFFKLDEHQLAERLRKLGYRYPNSRARYIVRARSIYEDIWRTLKSGRDPLEIRRWLSENVSGLGFKEASHFLRNIGFKNVAIVDKHVLRVLDRYGLIRTIPQRLSKTLYLKIEKTLLQAAGELGVSLAELDLYLWYMDTGKILK
ncbi:MAG: N-glycosylase/DNA lyase [Thermoproteota archaeon]